MRMRPMSLSPGICGFHVPGGRGNGRERAGGTDSNKYGVPKRGWLRRGGGGTDVVVTVDTKFFVWEGGQIKERERVNSRQTV